MIIIGGRYGSPISDSEEIDTKDFYHRYESVTKMEYESALKKDIPIYILIDKSVKAEYETFKNNRTNDSIKYAHVDSINIFHFIDRIFKQNRNNPVKEFEKHNEIEEWLRIQWAGMFKELIRKRSNNNEISDLASQISELSNINKTLKIYLEEIVSKTSKGQGKELIEREEERLKDERLKQKLSKNEAFEDLSRRGKSTEEIISLFQSSKSLSEFSKKYSEIMEEKDGGKRLLKHWKESKEVQRIFKEVTDLLEIDELK